MTEKSLWDVLKQMPEKELERFRKAGDFGSVPFGSSSLGGGFIPFSKEDIQKVLENFPVGIMPGLPGRYDIKEILTPEQYAAVTSTINCGPAGYCHPQNTGDVAKIIWKGYCLSERYRKTTQIL